MKYNNRAGKISVIVTAYNRDKFLTECINSIINQSYKNLEIIVIDDCSVDNTENTVKELINIDGRIKYIKHSKNKGAGAAKNTGIEAASGHYITFVDSDDKLANKYAYETAIKVFMQKNIDVYTYGYAKDENTSISKKYRKYKVNASNMFRATTMLPMKIFKAEQLKKIRNNESIIYDDIPFWVDFCLTNMPVIYETNNKFYMGIKIRNSKIITQNEENNIHIFKACDEVRKIINTKGHHIRNSQNILYSIFNGNILSRYVFIKNAELKEQYRLKAKEYIKQLDDSLNIIGRELNIKYMSFFIDDETARKKYLNDIEIFKVNDYRYIKPNKIIFKIKREILRVINQLKSLFNY